MPNSSSRAMTSSTVSRLSAPRSSTNEASAVTVSSSTPSWSTMIFFTRSATGSIRKAPQERSPAPLGGETAILHREAALHMEAAVHGQHLAGDVGGGVGDEVED